MTPAASPDSRLPADALDSELTPDLSPLAWVQDELQRSLEAVHKSLRRMLRDGDIRLQALGSEAQPSQPLVAAAAQLHQAAAVVSLVGQAAVALLLRAAEQAVATLAQQPANVDVKTVEMIERADFALLAFMARLLAGNKVSPLTLFPSYRELQTFNGAERIHPADLWPQPWRWLVLPVDSSARPLAAVVVRGPFESTLLKQMREPNVAYARALSELCAALAAGLTEPHSKTLWQLAAALFQAQAMELLNTDAFTKRLGSRLLSQLRVVAQGDAGVAERLAQDLLFFCAQSRPTAAGQVAQRLADVRAAYGLDADAAGDYEDESLGRIDPAWVSQARRRVVKAKQSWGSAAEGDNLRLIGLEEQFAVLAESLQRLFPSGEVLGGALQRAAVATLRSGKEPVPALAMEVATSLLYVEAALDEASFDQPVQPERVRRLAHRIEAAMRGDAAEPLEAWMEDLYRRVSDRTTMGSVVQELRASLSEIERQADEYFRDPSQRQLLIPVPGQLSAMRGVLKVLGLDQAAAACLRMRNEVDELANTEVDIERAAPRELFDRLANNLGALGFLIDMLGVQPHLAKTQFVFDEASGRLDSVMGRRISARPTIKGADSPLPAVLESPAWPLAVAEPVAPLPFPLPPTEWLDLPLPNLTDARAVVDARPADPPAAQPHGVLELTSLAAAPPDESIGLAAFVDIEMQEIFLEEAAEVLAAGRVAVAALQQDGRDAEPLTVLRRAFHTLKGNARMVGLNAMGEGAWACEQLYNARLGETTPQADAALLRFTSGALDYLTGWCEQIAARATGQFLSEPLRRGADALRLPAEVLPAALEHGPELELVPPLGLELEPEAEKEAEDFVLGLPGEVLRSGAAEVAEFEPPEFELRLELGEPAAPEVSELPELPAMEEEVLAGLVEPMAADVPELEALEFKLEFEFESQPEPEPEPEPEPAPPLIRPPMLELVRSSSAAANEAAAGAAEEAKTGEQADAIAAIDAYPDAEDNVKVIGGLRINITLFNIFLNEADELSRRLAVDLAEWALELGRQIPLHTEGLAHALAGNAAAVGFDDLSSLARALERALARAQCADSYSEAEAQLFVRAADDIRHLLHQFAAGFLKSHDAALVARLQAYEPPDAADSQAAELAVNAAELAELETASPAAGEMDDIDAVLYPIFEEEADGLLEQLHGAMREWLVHPEDIAGAAACMRALHTFKGGARLTGAMSLGEQAHRLESAIEEALGQDESRLDDLLAVQDRLDTLAVDFERLSAAQRAGVTLPAVLEQLAPVVGGEAEAEAETETEAEAEAEAEVEPAAVTVAPREPIDWQPFITSAAETAAATEAGDGAGAQQAMVRVRASLLERMAAQAGEVSIRRARLESELAQMKSSLLDLDENLERMRSQLRELELQVEAQVGVQPDPAQLLTTGAADSAALNEFDLLEFDRYTRFQELTRMLAEAMGDVATVQRSLQRNVQLGEDELAAQSRLTRDLQDDLLRTRMVEFDSMAERMHRVVRQAARDAGRQAQLEIIGGQTELDRSVLERMAGAFEHLLRNSVSHGIEPPERRRALGKDVSGRVTVQLRQEGNEVLLDVSDDGAGLDLARIRERGVQLGLLKADEPVDDAGLTQLIFAPGFSTAGQLTAVSGRGVGMDVVRSEVGTLGGAIEIHTEAGQGTRFSLRLPLTTALTQVVLLRCAEHSVAVPAGLMASVQRVPAAQIEAAYASGHLQLADQKLPFYWLGGLLGQGWRGQGRGKHLPVLVMRNGRQGLALHVDEVLGNQEVVVKHLGPQLGRVPGLAGISLLASGEVALIYNPVVLADWYGAAAQQRQADAPGLGLALPLQAEPTLAPLVLVVDDSLTVRRITQRLLEREGYRVQLAKDGLDAMEYLAGVELPALVLSDIEMPRMDGFDLLRNIRADARLAALPVLMITSRIAMKHRDYAKQLGADHYLGKPYDEQVLLALIGRYTRGQIGGSAAASASEN